MISNDGILSLILRLSNNIDKPERIIETWRGLHLREHELEPSVFQVSRRLVFAFALQWVKANPDADASVMDPIIAPHKRVIQLHPGVKQS